MKRRLVYCILFVLAFLLVACGGGGGDESPTIVPQTALETPEEAQPTEAAAVAPTEAPAATAAAPTKEAVNQISSFSDAIKATVQIEGQGSFMDPEFGMQLNTAGRGSGFIVDPSGIAITNNHVVTGAAFLQVWIGGDTEPHNARVLGVSECSDLAVIDIDGEGYPYLTWDDTDAPIGTEVYALGFPLGDPEPTITRGIISKANAGGETSWASVDSVIEHDATINPGNSGGPLVTNDGKVVGVNYAGDPEVSQYFAINAADAQAVINGLEEGHDVTSIGINGEAVSDGEGLTGIWVASVESGSPADKAGIEAGDIITKMEGLILATDGTMADYCDILRSNGADDVMSVEVLRYATQEVLEGQVNGRELAQTVSFAVAAEEAVQGNTTTDGGTTEGGTTEDVNDYVGIYDDAQAVYVEVPSSWAEVDGSFWYDDDGVTVLGSELIAAPSIDGYSNTYETPGIQILASTGLSDSSMDELLDLFDFSTDCAYDGRSDYEDPVFTGRFDLYTDCAGVGSVIAVVAAQPADLSYAVVIIGQAITEADLNALDHVWDTFNVVGTLPQ